VVSVLLQRQQLVQSLIRFLERLGLERRARRRPRDEKARSAHRIARGATRARREGPFLHRRGGVGVTILDALADRELLDWIPTFADLGTWARWIVCWKAPPVSWPR
jgi:hypothetical protein